MCIRDRIVIDEKSKRRYAKAATGLNNIEKNLARELRRCVNWREGVFRQDTEKRCAFLNQNNLCRLYQMAGPDSLCRTCKMYPRHIEEFEGVREITLSLSCLLYTSIGTGNFSISTGWKSDRWKSYDRYQQAS